MPASERSEKVRRREVDRGRGHRDGIASDIGLGACRLANLEGLPKGVSQRAVDQILCLGGLKRSPHLPENLRLPDHHRVDARCDSEQVPDGAVVVIRVKVVGELFGRYMAELTQEIAQVLGAAVEPRYRRVNLDAVAGGQHRSLETPS